jgi:excisionase family DNA binding protein
MLLSLAEVQCALAISKPTLMRLVAEGELPTVRIRRRRLVHPDDLAAFVAERREPRNDDGPVSAGRPSELPPTRAAEMAHDNAPPGDWNGLA